jgi:hypothetical protein
MPAKYAKGGQEIRNGGRGAAVALRGEEEPGVLCPRFCILSASPFTFLR